MNNINKINDAWIASGQKVSDLNAKLNAAVLDDKFDEKTFTEMKNQRDQEKAHRDALKDQLDEARAQDVLAMDDKDKKPLTPVEKNLKDKFVSNFKAMMRGDAKVLNLATSSTDAEGNAIGLVIPSDIQTAIHTLVRQMASLEQYVNVENVTTANGSRVYEKMSTITPLTALDDEDAEIKDNDDPKLQLVKYVIKRFAGITTATNSLLKDTTENILAWLEGWIAKKVVVTRNSEITKVLNNAPKKASIKSFDDVKDLNLNGVDPAIAATSFYLTNQTGYSILSKVKDAMGRYIMQPTIADPTIKQIDGKQVLCIADRWLADPAKDTHPLYFGDLKQAITLFDREQMSILVTNIGAGAFEKDQTKVRVIDRFDVQPTDTDAVAVGSFSTIADQKANFAAAAATTDATTTDTTKA
ncbi:phage major capsid protein [Lapidilactobacillus wuchangensis]|uniref:phage major capsid protein n=1 Tax=Lapidilactobacillus wuchangensis TaxID=2486001 RepID=UPI000F766BAA|nr:phage major capsid protein [Lapidilactobacillus wuchangensis]